VVNVDEMCVKVMEMMNKSSNAGEKKTWRKKADIDLSVGQ